MLNLEQTVIQAINGNLGLGEDCSGYDTGVLAQRIKNTASRIIIPTGPNQEFLDFLQSGSDVVEFMNRCIREKNQMLSLAFHACLPLQGPEDTVITSALLENHYKGSPYVSMLGQMLDGLTITIGEIHAAHKMALAWHHRKLSTYVAELWQTVRAKREEIGESIFNAVENHKYLIPAGTEAQQEVSFMTGIMQMRLSRFVESITDTINTDPQFETWKQIDVLLNPARAQTMNMGQSRIRATKVMQIGIKAGLDTAGGYLQVALDKCQSHRASALAIYRNSFRDLFGVIGMMDHSFIAAFAELVRKPDTVREMAGFMRYGRTVDMMGVLGSNRAGNLIFDAKFHASTNTPGEYDKFLRIVMQADRIQQYNAEFFEITPEGKLRVRQWMIDFVRLVNANSSESVNEVIPVRGCPMMHGKTNNTAGEGVVFMQDFSETVADIMEQYWQQ